MTQLPDGPSAVPVPVFNCVVNVSPPGSDGAVVARVANLAGIEGRGRSEREALAAAVAEFKCAVARYHTAGEAVPWLTDVVQPQQGETQRLIAVHL